MAASLEFSSVAEFRTAAGDHVQESGRNDQQKLQIRSSSSLHGLRIGELNVLI